MKYFVFGSSDSASAFINEHFRCFPVPKNPDMVKAIDPAIIEKLRRVATEVPKPDDID